MRMLIHKDGRRQRLIRFFSGHHEVAYIVLGIRGLEAEIEFPSDWHEARRVWVRLGFGLITICFSFPWSRTVPDEGQCSGPTYGFNFFGDGLHLHWGKQIGKRNDPFTIIAMPWQWRQRQHNILTKPEFHSYQYRLKSGEVQDVVAEINIETRMYVRPWIPYKKTWKYIDIEFSEEVGERRGSWKGGCLGCSYEMLPGENALQTLRRMEAERKFA